MSGVTNVRPGDAAPRPPVAGVPLATRTRLARSVGRVLFVFGASLLGIGVVARLATGAASPWAAVAIAITPLALLGYVSFGRWHETLGSTGQEVLLSTLGAVCVVWPIAVLATADPGDVRGALVIPAALIGTALLLRPWLHALATVVTGVALGIIIWNPAIAPELALFPAVVAVVVGALAGMATRWLARASVESDQRGARLGETVRALGAVVTAARVSSTLDQDAVLQAVVAATGELGADASALLLLDDDGRLRYAASWQLPEHHGRPVRHPGDGLPGEVLRTERSVVVDDYDRYPGASSSMRRAGLRSAVGAPLTLDDGRVIGVLTVGRRSAEPWSDGVVAALELIARHAARTLDLSRTVVEDRQMLTALRALHQQQADFVATVSHELRTPLTVVQGMATTLRERGSTMAPALRGELVERIVANTDVLASIIEALLDTARLDGGLTASDSHVRMLDVATGAVERLAAVSPDHTLVLEATTEGLVVADADLLQRVVDNLVTNAMRHTPTGTTVTIRVVEEHDRVVVRVADDGPGIDPGLLPRITERFVRGGDVHTRSSRGLGIGLSLVDEVLRLHGTRLEVTSVEGEGATFGFSLPLSAATEPMTITAIDEPPVPAQSATRRR